MRKNQKKSHDNSKIFKSESADNEIQSILPMKIIDDQNYFSPNFAEAPP
jgi:hypothetical protein